MVQLNDAALLLYFRDNVAIQKDEYHRVSHHSLTEYIITHIFNRKGLP
jgi:hypothetical protein